MLTVNVLLSGRLKLDGYGRGHEMNDDTTFRLALNDGSTVQDVIGGMRVPSEKVALTMINGCQCPADMRVRPGDRVILIPQDVAVLWGAFRRQNLGMSVGLDA
ncbi:MAG: hypothetical protein HY782_09185 [Chloroflexi bacterium]|nr:hypothetical protein [Chloroflexota bacterium]